MKAKKAIWFVLAILLIAALAAGGVTLYRERAARLAAEEHQRELDAVEEVVRKYARPLMVGAVDPDDPELGLEAFRKALKEAGIDDLKTEVERQYKEWKDSLQ